MKNFENVIFEPKTKEEAKQDIYLNTQELISWLDDNISWINHLAEIINSEQFKNFCFNNLEIV